MDNIGMSKTGLYWNKKMIWDWNKHYRIKTISVVAEAIQH